MLKFLFKIFFKQQPKPKSQPSRKAVRETASKPVRETFDRQTDRGTTRAAAKPKTQQSVAKIEPEVFDKATAHPVTLPRVLEGPAYVTDGDTIKIKMTQIRLYGIDAPELHHPYGKKAKWALVRLCKGQDIRAEILEEDEYGRTVAKCFLPDGRDLSEGMVRQGLAIDWPKYSGGKYSNLEVANIRRKLWLADARQKGRMHVWDKFDSRKN